jgi:uncharacterized protein YuzE
MSEAMTDMSVLPFTMTYAPEAGVVLVYIYNRGRRSQRGVVAKTVEVDDVEQNGGVYLDYDKEGKLFGVEILNPGKITLVEVLKLLEPLQEEGK